MKRVAGYGATGTTNGTAWSARWEVPPALDGAVLVELTFLASAGVVQAATLRIEGVNEPILSTVEVGGTQRLPVRWPVSAGDTLNFGATVTNGASVSWTAFYELPAR